jgi:hypothetical protein
MERVRVGNRKGGAIEVSLDGGQNWATVGRVVKPATDTGPGFTALAGAAPGTVAAIGVDGLTVRTDRAPAKADRPETRIIRLAPAGGVATALAIGTDVPRGRAIFGSLSPVLGSEVFLETPTGGSRPLPGGYIPQTGDHLLIVASVPVTAPAMLVIENREGGQVLSVSPTGDETAVGRVRQPLRGVARYPAAAGATCGGVVSHHLGGLLVATTPAHAAEPGGFLIQPGTGSAAGKPEEGSVLVVDRLTGAGSPLALPISLSPTDGSLAGETRVEARLDGGPWEPLPAVGGAAPTALTAEALSKQFAAQGTPRQLSDGVTHLRLILAPPTRERLRADLARATGQKPLVVADLPSRSPAAPLRSRPAGRTPPKVAVVEKTPAKTARKATKTLRVVATIQGQGIAYVMFYVDGRIRKMTNTPPFIWLWDTRTTPNGVHSLEIRGADTNGRILTTQTQQVTVSN